MGKKMAGLLLFGLGCLLVLRSGTGEASIGNIKEFLNTCPKNDPAYNQIKSDFTIRHNGVIVPMDGIACDEPTSSMNIAQYTVELIVLQGLRTIYYMDYGQSGHLPWTPGTMYQWMKSKIKGFNIDDTATYNSCCDGSFPGGPYVTLTKSDDFNRDFDRAWKGIAGNIGLYAHEVRHLDGPGHVNCNGSANDWDYDPANISSFGTQWWLEKSWLNGEINGGYACLSSAEKQDIAAWHLTSANMFRDRFCNIQPPLLTAPSNPAGPCLEAQALPWKIITVDSALDYGQYAAIVIDPRNNLPYISYYNATNHHLRLANPVTTGGNCGPGSSWFCQTVDSNPNVGKYSSIGISPPGLSRELGISYVDDTNHTLKYYYDYCFLGTCHQVIETVDSGLNPITYTSLKFDSNGIPHIAYLGSCGANCSRLKYAKWVGSGGTCGTGNHWKCDQVDAVANANYPSLDLNGSDKPRIAYYNGGTMDLRYGAACGSNNCGNCGPNNSWQCDTLDAAGTVGLFPSLKLDRGASENPRIAYHDSTKGKLKYAAKTAPGNCGPGNTWQCDSIADMGIGLSGSLGISLAVDPAGKPLIAYLDASEALAPSRLRVAQSVSAPGLGNCGPLYNWECNTVDGGGSWTNEGSFVSLAFNSKGKPIIAYYEEDSYTDGNLKVATLWDQLFLPLILKNP